MSEFHSGALNDGDTTSVANITSVTTIVPAPGAGYRIVVLAYLLSLDADGEYFWSSAATALMGTQEVTADTPVGASNAHGVLRCAANEALRLTSTTAANGWVRWARVRV